MTFTQLRQRKGDGSDIPDRRHFAAVAEDDRIIQIARRRFHQRNLHAARILGIVLHRLDRLAGDLRGPKFGPRRQLDLQKLLGAVEDAEGLLGPIGAVFIDDRLVSARPIRAPAVCTAERSFDL